MAAAAGISKDTIEPNENFADAVDQLAKHGGQHRSIQARKPVSQPGFTLPCTGDKLEFVPSRLPARRMQNVMNRFRIGLLALALAGCGDSSGSHASRHETNSEGMSAKRVEEPEEKARAEVDQSSNAESRALFKDKTAAHWIDQLRASSDSRARAEAAEALGFIAREGPRTPGGFSDVPFDSVEPEKLSDEALRPVIAGLVAGLQDDDGRVRASAAVAVSWIGERASAALPELIRLVRDDREDSRKNAIKAIGRIGPAAKSAIPHLQPMLVGPNAIRRVEVAEALRLIGAPPDAFLPTLIEVLGQDGPGSADHYAAMELAHLGNPAVNALKQCLKDKNPATRKNAAYTLANMAGWGNLTKDRESVADALIELTLEADSKVVWKGVQALGSVKAAPERSVPALVSLLAHNDRSVVDEAAESLGDFGAEAKRALPALTKLLADVNGEHFHSAAMAIREIGIDRESADAIGTLKIGAAGLWLVVPMCAYPEAAVEFLERNPEAVDVPGGDQDELIRLMRGRDPRFERLQKWLYRCETLPLGVMAELRDERFLPLLERKLKTADTHAKTQWEACARACGAAPGRVVAISESEPGDFKPKSAWPDTDPARMSPEMRGHGDGSTTVIITGRILRAGGAPVVAPRFYRVNDAWLLGKRMRNEVPFTFDKETGQFVFVTNVFAAYSHGDAQQEPGPYQTGSTIVLIECDDCKPLEVRFYDEMPEVRITMSMLEKRPGK